MHPPRKVSRNAHSHQRSINFWCPPPGKPRRSKPWGRHRGSVNQGEPRSARPANSLRALQAHGGTEKARARALEVHALTEEGAPWTDSSQERTLAVRARTLKVRLWPHNF